MGYNKGMTQTLGHTLLIVNPASKMGEGAIAGEQAAALLREAGVDLAVSETTAPLHAVELAAAAGEYDTVIALGGDGVIHEAANGLMRIPADKRPAFGIIPVGSGNDYARTLGVSEDVITACKQLLNSKKILVDVGLCNGQHFLETVSFGLDAAIALDTVERRKHTKKTGNALYLEAGLNQLVFHRDMHDYTVAFDEESPVQGQSLIFALQLGPTYGGGFRVCPQADPTDGLFDVCIAHPPLGLVRATKVFLSAKDGKHVGHKSIEMRQCSRAQVHFRHAVPAQMDGEDCTGTDFDVTLLPQALTVLFA